MGKKKKRESEAEYELRKQQLITEQAEKLEALKPKSEEDWGVAAAGAMLSSTGSLSLRRSELWTTWSCMNSAIS